MMWLYVSQVFSKNGKCDHRSVITFISCISFLKNWSNISIFQIIWELLVFYTFVEDNCQSSVRVDLRWILMIPFGMCLNTVALFLGNFLMIFHVFVSRVSRKKKFLA